MPSKLDIARSKIERIRDEALKAMDKPRVPQKTKADLKRIANQAMAALKLLNEPDPKKRQFFQSARAFFIWLVPWLRRLDGT